MNQPINWTIEYKAVIGGVEYRVKTNGNGSGWRWFARRILDSKTLAVSKPYPKAEPALEEVQRWADEQKGNDDGNT